MKKTLIKKAVLNSLRNDVLDEARRRMSVEKSYTIKIPDYVIDAIEKEWTPILAKHKCVFTPENAIQAIVRAEASRLVTEKIFGKSLTIK